MRSLARATDHRPLAFEARKLNNPGESRIKHFNDSADKAETPSWLSPEAFQRRRDLAGTGVHNGMNEDRDIPRFGGDD